MRVQSLCYPLNFTFFASTDLVIVSDRGMTYSGIWGAKDMDEELASGGCEALEIT